MASLRELRNEVYEEMIEERKIQLERVTQKSRSLKKEVAELEAEIMFFVACGKKDYQECKEMQQERNNKYREYTTEVDETKETVRRLNDEIDTLEALKNKAYQPV